MHDRVECGSDHGITIDNSKTKKPVGHNGINMDLRNIEDLFCVIDYWIS
jgi:hypothetical protein